MTLRYLQNILFAVLCLTVGIARAQDAAERRYRQGVQLVQQGQYEKAKAELTPLLQRRDGLGPYAHYYHALADFRLKNQTGARLMLRQLLDRFPDWNKADDAYYLMAAASFEGGLYEEGLTFLSRLSGTSLKADVQKLESAHFARITELNRLKSLQREYPDNRNLALALIDLIQRTSTDRSDLELSDRLTNRFGVPTASASNRPAVTEPVASTTASGVNPARPERNRNKGYFNVGVLFPFRLNQLNPGGTARSNQYALDLYNGMKLAQEKLQQEGVTVNLFAYDVENDAAKMTELLNNPSFIQNDLLFGPLYAEPNRIATEFASRNGLPLVNPISTSSELVASQPLAFLAQPSLTQQALQTLTFARTLGMGKRVAIYFGSTRKDSTLAAIYQQEARKVGFQILEFKKLAGDTEQITLTEASRAAHILLVSSDEKTGPKLLKTLSARKVTAPVIATSGAFDFTKNSLSVFERSELYLLYPDFVDNKRPEVESFNQAYLETRNIIPSVFAYQGYDMLLFFGRMLARNRGVLPQGPPLKSEREDYLIAGFDYSQSNENRRVPIVKFEEGQFIIANE
ncbi:ABC transporter substrate-binding protein [Tellurirhabdus rosea]|uniref:ABC transporter substrate-binding protein n=1 Tax=Tellurirhabdus rosea TaxID=2674997 RepID=UPI00225A1ACE|nr:ABC transporter substrate-binding protein [Tellurirhabdus rosea]